MRFKLAGLFLLNAITAFGQKETILTNVTIIDGTGAAPLTHRAIVIRDGKIAAITRGKISPSPDAIQVDMTGKYIMPEIIDCHSHIGNLKGTSTSAENYTPANVRRQLAHFQDYGITAILSMGTDQPVGIALRDSSKAGQIPGATLFSAIYGFGVKDAMPPGMSRIYRPETPDEAIKDVRELAGFHPDVVKMWVDDFYGQFRKDQVMKKEIYSAIIREAHKAGIRVAAHLYHLADARSLVDAGVDIMAHSIRDEEIDEALISEMKKNHVSYIPTLSLDEFGFSYTGDPSWLNDPFFRLSLEPGVYEMITSPSYKEKQAGSSVAAQEKQALPMAQKNLLKIYKAGIPVALGTDAGASPVRAQGFSEHMEMELMVKSGLTPLEVISIATRNGARLLKIDDRQGTLEAGKAADFIVLDKDPLQDIRNTRSISAVWNNGVKVSNGPLASAQ